MRQLDELQRAGGADGRNAEQEREACESGRLKPKKRPAVMVTPERLVPGISERLRHRAESRVMSAMVLFCGLCMSTHEDGVENGVPGDDRDVPFKIGHVQLLEHEPERDSRDGGKADIDREPAFRRYLALEQEQGPSITLITWRQK
jgi:hypothetical protein